MRPCHSDYNRTDCRQLRDELRELNEHMRQRVRGLQLRKGWTRDQAVTAYQERHPTRCQRILEIGLERGFVAALLRDLRSSVTSFQPQ